MAWSLTSLVCADVLRIGLTIEPSSMDPHFSARVINSATARHVFDNLIHETPSLDLEPGLAESWLTLDDTTWEFKLRSGVSWHDGSAFTAADVKYSFERVLHDPGLSYGSNGVSAFANYLSFIKEFIIVDPLTFLLKTAEPYPMLLTKLANIAIISQKHGQGASTADYNSGKAMIGTGPYKFVKYIPGDRLIYVRHENYWGGVEPWDKVIRIALSDNETSVAALLSGNVDIIGDMPPVVFLDLKKNPNINIFQAPSARLRYLVIDSHRDSSPFVTEHGKPTNKNPLKDLRVRQALSKAIHREGITSKVFKGLAIPAGQILPEGFFARSPNLRAERYDPEGAKQLLKEAGWKDDFSLTIHGSVRFPTTIQAGSVRLPTVIQAIAQMWTRIGIRTQAVDLVEKNFLPASDNLPYSVALLGWSSAGEPTSLMAAMLHSYDKGKGFGGMNVGRYSHPKFDKLLERALRTMNRRDHEKILIKATDIVIKDLGFIPLYWLVNVWAARKGLSYVKGADKSTFAFRVRKIDEQERN